MAAMNIFTADTITNIGAAQRLIAGHKMADTPPEPSRLLLQQGLSVTEEAGEVARAILKRDRRVRGSVEQWTTQLHEEIADVAISLMALAELEHINLGDAVNTRLHTILARVNGEHTASETH